MKVFIGVDPHKLSVTIEVVDDHETVLTTGRFSTDNAGDADPEVDVALLDVDIVHEDVEQLFFCSRSDNAADKAAFDSHTFHRQHLLSSTAPASARTRCRPGSALHRGDN
jgi:hypothetical protein